MKIYTTIIILNLYILYTLPARPMVYYHQVS